MKLVNYRVLELFIVVFNAIQRNCLSLKPFYFLIDVDRQFFFWGGYLVHTILPKLRKKMVAVLQIIRRSFILLKYFRKKTMLTIHFRGKSYC